MLGAGGILVTLTLPETHAPTILIEKAKRHRQAHIPGFHNVKTETEDNDTSLLDTYWAALLRPWVLLFDLISFLCRHLHGGSVYAAIHALQHLSLGF